MNRHLKRLFVLSEMHSFQVIALVGLVMSGLAHGILWFTGKEIDSFLFIYPSWAGIFLLGYLLNFRDQDPHHHH